MNPRVVAVRAEEGLSLIVTFANGEQKRFDASPCLMFPVFARLRDVAYFRLARAEGGTVAWPDGTDFCPDTLYVEGQPV